MNESSQDKMLPFNLTHMYAESVREYRLKFVAYPVLAVALLVGVITITAVAMKRSIRAFSSIIYLVAIGYGDLLWSTGRYIPSYLITSNPDLQLSDRICTIVIGARFFGQIYTGLLILALAIDRCLMLTAPKRFAGILTYKTAILVSLILTAVTTCLIGYLMSGNHWDSRLRMCTMQQVDKPYENSPAQATYGAGLVTTMIFAQLSLSILVTILTARKRRSRQIDPIHNSIARAQRHSSQLNRINLITCLIALHYTCGNLFVYASYGAFYQIALRSGFELAQFITSIFELISFIVTSTRMYVVVAVSAKVRQEILNITRCFFKSSQQQVMINQIQYKYDTARGHSKVVLSYT